MSAEHPGYQGTRDLTEEEQQMRDAIPWIADLKDYKKEEDLEEYLPDEEEVTSNGMCRLTFLWREDHLLLHFWRGDSVPDAYWGQGDFGVRMKQAVEQVFPTDKSIFEYVPEVSSYFVVVPSAGLKPRRPNAPRIAGIGEILTGLLNEDLAD